MSNHYKLASCVANLRTCILRKLSLSVSRLEREKGCGVRLLLLCAWLAAAQIYRRSGYKLHVLKTL